MEELTITAYTRSVGNSWVLFMFGHDVPKQLKGSENLKSEVAYRVRLKNTNNLDLTTPGWFKKLNKDGTVVDIETDSKNVSIVKDKDNKYIINVILEDNAECEFWYGEEW